MKRAIVSVINDLVTDRRVDKTCNTLVDLGFDVLLVGRKLPDSLPLTNRRYKMRRMKLLFKTGPLFYAEYNIRLFFFLFFQKSGLLFANDLDTLLPNFFVSLLKNIPIVYDSHEYFTETPELVNRPFVQAIWRRIEQFAFPKVKDVITVNDSIAALFKEKYGNDVNVVRNIPPSPDVKRIKTRQELGLPQNIPIVLLQGSGINIHRGAEELVEAMQFISNAHLIVIGAGDVINQLKAMRQRMNLESKITFYPKMPFDELFHFTANADLGMTLDKDTNINYRYSLPNKLFDYIHAGVPALASPLVEVKKIIDRYHVGEIIESHQPELLAQSIRNMLTDKKKLVHYRANCKTAAAVLNWETEKETLIEILRKHV